MSKDERQSFAIRLYNDWQETDTSDSLEIYCYKQGKKDGYNKAIDDVLKLPKHTIYDTSNEFMNIRIDTISIEDILKLKE